MMRARTRGRSALPGETILKKSDRDRPLNEIADDKAKPQSSPVHARYQSFQKYVKPTCVGCKFRKRMGQEVWCANMTLPHEQRPHGDAMRGCPFYEAGTDDSAGGHGIGRTLEKIAFRRRVR